jgi:hypothetical protein
MTFFIRIQSPDNNSPNHTDLNYVFIDDGRFATAPTVNLNVPPNSDATINLQWTASTAPGWTLQGVEVQYKDNMDNVWHMIQDKTDTNTTYVLQGQLGHIYTVRARAWQTDGYEDLHGLWVEKQVQVGGVFAGYVYNNFGAGIEGAQISATGVVTTSGPGGFYALKPQIYGQLYAVTASASGYPPLLPVQGSVADDSSLTSITFTLKPANDAIINGDFETDTSGWTLTGPGTGSIFSGEHRSGSASLKLTGDKTLTRTVKVSDTYNPLLAFWYRPDLSGDATFEVSLEGEMQIFTGTGSSDWQHGRLPLGLPGTFDGPLTVTFHLSGGEVWLDEVSLGDGPHTMFLPIVKGSTVP